MVYYPMIYETVSYYINHLGKTYTCMCMLGVLPVVYISIMLELTVSYMISEKYLVMLKQSYYPLIDYIYMDRNFGTLVILMISLSL